MMFDTSSHGDAPSSEFHPDATSQRLAFALREFDPEGGIIARTFRETYDQLYDGMNTGRYRWDQLHKTEKTHFGTLIEINLRRALDGFLSDGRLMDFHVHLPADPSLNIPEVNAEVDCKFSQTRFAWMIPNEAVGHWAMVCHASDEDATWSVGFVHIIDDILTRGGNRDQKRTIRKAGRSAIFWAWEDRPLPPNVLLQLPRETTERILSHKSGQKRIDELFTAAVGTLIPRGTVATTAMQKDYMKRVRSSGGARTNLQKDGIIILGGYKFHRLIAARLDLPIPGDGDSVSAYVKRANLADATSKRVFLNDDWWVLTDKTGTTGPAPTFGHTPTPLEKERL